MGNRLSLLALVAVLGACQSGPGPEPPTPTGITAPTTTGTSIAVDDREGRAYDVLAIGNHPNGAQLRLERVEILTDSVVVSGGLSNGSPFGLTLGRGHTELISDRGEAAHLLDSLDTTVEPSGEIAFTLRFSPLEDARAVTLIFNSGAGSSPVSPTTTSPSFELGPILLDPDGTRPPLPDPVPIRRSLVSPSGVELQIEGINFADNRIGVWVRISNPLGLEARIAPSVAPALLVDDLGNRYPLMLPEGEGWVSIPPGSARSGVLSFVGRIHPDARELNLGINAGAGSDQTRVYPEFVLQRVPLTGDTASAPLPDPVALDAELTHPNGVRLAVGTARFTDTAIEVPVVIENERTDAVALAGAPTHVFDDRGNRYPLAALPDNPQLVLDPGTTIEATLAFSGRIADDAGEINLAFNSGRSPDDPDTRQPAFSFGPLVLVRGDEAPDPIEAIVFAVSARTRLVPDELAVSQVDQITQTLTQFGATEVDGGFQLTLPDSILFDFGSSALRGDANQALRLIAEVLDYFEGDRAIVVGHTDSIGSDSANQALSEARARTVLEALIALGVDPDRLTSEGRGSSEPIAPNANPDGSDNPDGRQLNRRVEIVVLTDRDLPLP